MRSKKYRKKVIRERDGVRNGNCDQSGCRDGKTEDWLGGAGGEGRPYSGESFYIKE